MSLTEQAREAKRAYMKSWRAKNKDKVKQHQQKYWEKKALEQECSNAGI